MNREQTELRKQIRAMWEQKLEVETQLHIMLDRRRHIVSSLRTA